MRQSINIFLINLYFNKYVKSIPITLIIITYLSAKGIVLTEGQVDDLNDFIVGTACYEPHQKLQTYIAYIRHHTGHTGHRLSETDIIYILDATVKNLREINSDFFGTIINTLQNLYKDDFIFDVNTNEFKHKLPPSLEALIPAAAEPIVNSDTSSSSSSSAEESEEDSESESDDETPQNPYLKYGLMALSALIVLNTVYTKLFA